MLTSSNYTLFQGSYQTILTLSESSYQTRVNTFSEFISNITSTTPKQHYTLFQTWSNPDIFRELLSNNTIHFSRAYIKQYWHFQSYGQTILHTFPKLTSNNTDIFRELLANSTTHFSKLNYPKKFFQSLNVLFRAYNLIIKRITRSAIIVEINTKDVKLVKTNISSLYSKRHL